VRIDSRFAQAQYQLGMVLDKNGKSAEAIKALEEAARLDASYPEPHYALARLYRLTGDTKRADAALESFHRLKKEKGQTGPRPR
jgi:Flp pilus assembly protein TadD